VAETAPQAIGFRSTPVAFELLLRSPADVQVLRAAPWWTARKLGAVALAAIAAAALAAGWAAVLRRQVRRQTRVIASKLHTEAWPKSASALPVSFTIRWSRSSWRSRCGSIPPRQNGANSRANPAAKLPALVERLQSTGRDFIWDLREHTMARKICAARSWRRPKRSARKRAPARGDAHRRPCHCAGRHRHACVRWPRKACANAIRHGHARKVTITVDYSPSTVRLQVVDDARASL